MSIGSGIALAGSDVARLLGFVDQFSQIARDAFASGDRLLGVRAITLSAQYLQAAREIQRMHDAFAAHQDVAVRDARLTDPRLTLCRVVAPHFVAGFLIDKSRCRIAAPILAWTVGKHIDDLDSYFRRKGWKCTGLPVSAADPPSEAAVFTNQ